METAIQAIYRDMEYARSLIKHRNVNPDNDIGDEESWTFIGDDSDPELVRRIAEWEHMGRRSGSTAPTYDGGALATRFMKKRDRDSSASNI